MTRVAKKTPVVEIEEVPETLRVYCWRHEELMRVGYPLIEATKIASRTDVDLHEACSLVADGCSPELAARILL